MDERYENINTLKNYIPVINSGRNYWLVRTNGGVYFRDFHLNDYIAIGWDAITDIALMNESKREALTAELKKVYSKSNEESDEGGIKDGTKYGLIATQLIRFVSEMKKGDIVIIPSENSKHIAFGEILEDYIYTENLNIEELEGTECPYVKRRRIKWLKHQMKEQVDIYLYKILNSHHTITSANDHANIIDRTLSSLYIKDDIAHFTLKVNKNENIRIKDLSCLINNNINIVETFNKLCEENLNIDDVDIKINVHSPGPVEIYGAIKEVAIIAIVVIAVCGGSFKFMHKNSNDATETEAQISSDGFIEKIIKFMDHWHKNKMEVVTLKEQVNISKDRLKIIVPETADLSLQDLNTPDMEAALEIHESKEASD